jgi:hypothetical protein
MSSIHMSDGTVVQAEIPHSLRDARDAEEIQRIVWNAERDTAEIGGPAFESVEYTFLDVVFNTVRDPQDWRAKFIARHVSDQNGNDLHKVVKAAVVWFHGATPVVDHGATGVYSKGYQCW